MTGDRAPTGHIPRPMQSTPGRDSRRDAPAFDVGRAYWEQRHAIAEDAARLDALIEAVNWTNDLTPQQWAQWYATVLAFQPDLIVELGRGMGNSTALFTQALDRLQQGAVASLCLSDSWDTQTAPRIARFVPPEWFGRLFALRVDFLKADVSQILDAGRRVLILWDAHGFEVAELVLGRILPALQDKEHLLLLHDISDNRYAGSERSYGGQPLWKGAAWQSQTGHWKSRVNIGWMNSIQDQVVAIADFCVRNDLELGSADHEYHRFFAAHPEREHEMRATIGDRFFSKVGHWAFLTLNGRRGPFHFPLH